MYFYPEDIEEMAVALRVYASHESDPVEFDKWIERAESLTRVAAEAEVKYGSRASVSIDPSGARGYALPQKRA
jgi:hypothetical protein